MVIEITLAVFKASKKITTNDDDAYIERTLNVAKHLCNAIITKPYEELTDTGKELYNSVLFHYASNMYDNRELLNEKDKIPDRTIEHIKTLLMLESKKTREVL